MPPRTRVWRRGVLEREQFPVDDVSRYLEQDDTVVWVDLCAPDQEDLDTVTAEFGFEGLAVEDAVTPHERPKLDRYRDHLFLNTYAVHLDPGSGQLARTEVSAFLTGRALVTVRKDSAFPMDAVVQRWDDNPDLARHGVGYLVWGLLDVVVDGYFTALTDLDDAIEGLEDLLFSDRSRDREMQRRSFALRKSLVQVRRVLLPMREVVNTLLRRDLQVVDDAMTPYFQDVYDHVLRVTEWTESLRDLVSTILETHLTVQGNRLNDIMKKLTSWAAIIAVPTAVTGFFGQNVPYPGYGHHSGLIGSSVIMVVIAVALYVTFRRRNWL